MPATLASLFTGIDWDKKSTVNEQKGVEVRQAIQDGHFTQPDPFLVGMSKVGHNIGYLNGGHLFNLNALRCKDLTDGMMFGRKIAEEYLHFYRKYIPGCENLEHVTTASLIGVRESRRIVGEYELNIDDYIAKREFTDQIGVFNKFVDVHPYDCSEEAYHIHLEEKEKRFKLNPGEYFGIPYGMLDTEELVNTLRRADAYLPQSSLSGAMTRN